MNRKQVIELEIEYIVKDLKNGIKLKEELILRSKKRKLIPNSLRGLWEEKCLAKAIKSIKV